MYKEKDNNFLWRVATDIFLVGAVCWFPWWVSIVLAAVAFFYFNEFIELVLTGLLIDTLYAPHQVFSLSSYTYFFICLLLFGILSIARRQLR